MTIDVDDAVALLGDPTGGRGMGGDIAKQLDTPNAETEDILQSAV